MELRDNIKHYRKLNDLTLEELGKKIHVSKQTVQRYESGEISNIPYDKIVALADVFGVSASVLMGWEDVRKDYEIKGEIDFVVEPAPEMDEHITHIVECYKRLTPEQQKLVENMMKQMLPEEK